MKRPLYVLLLASAFAREASAQDSHYWSETYGTYATLLGGVVVGKVPDLSATFYNPGRLAFTSSAAFAFTTRVYELRSNQLAINGTNYGKVDLGTLGVKPSPSFAAGVLPVGNRQKWVVAYTLLARQADDETIRSDATTAPPATTSAELYWRRSASEFWTGLSASYRLSARTGIGGTLFGTYRSQNQRASLRAQTFVAPTPTASDVTRQFSYYEVGLLAKLGLSTQVGPWFLGAAVTTPGFGLFGSGDILTTELATGATTRFAWRSQEGLSPDYKRPWMASAGVTRTVGSVTGYFTTEWAGAVSQYALLDADSVVPSDGRPPYDNDVMFARQSVVNYGLGLEIRRSPSKAFYVHFKTDKSSRPAESGVDATYERWDRYHAGGGYSFRLGQWDLIAGLVYTWASDTFVAGEMDPPPVGIPLPTGATATVKEGRLRFLFGFNVRF